MFTIGGVGINLHKYLGVPASTGSDDPTQPSYANASERNIQDLLFLENRDRKYDTSIYNMRGIYQPTSSEFDLTQFGLFNSNDTIFIVFHYNDMVESIGRKIMNGDVLELEHLKDYHTLGDLPAALKRYYVVSDTTFASEGFSQTWWGHLWRVKCSPLVDSQEYKDILNKIKVGDPGDPYASPGAGDTSLSDLLSQYNKDIYINDAIIESAEKEVRLSGYDTTLMYVPPVSASDDAALPPDGVSADHLSIRLPNDVSNNDMDITRNLLSPNTNIEGYITGDGAAPNGLPTKAGTTFPPFPEIGDFCLRLDYFPNRLFRYDGKRWVKFEDNLRTPLTPGEAQTRRSLFVNNNKTHIGADGQPFDERQSLSRALRINPDN